MMEQRDINEAKNKNESDEKSALGFHDKLSICVIIVAWIGGTIIQLYFVGSEITLKAFPVCALILGGLILAIKKGWMGGRGKGSSSSSSSGGGCGGGCGGG
jgi:uncharacterized membrane protein YgcG